MNRRQIMIFGAFTVCVVFGQNCSNGFHSDPTFVTTYGGSTGAPIPNFPLQKSLLQNVLYQFDASQPAQSAEPALNETAMQVDSSGHLLSIRDSVSAALAKAVSGKLTLVTTGGPNSNPYFHGDGNSVNSAYDSFVLPTSLATPLVGPPNEPWSIVFVMRQLAQPTHLLEIHGSAFVDVYGSGAADGSLSVGQNNDHAYGTEPMTALTALNQWQIVSVICDGSTISIYRNGMRTLQTPSGVIGGVTGTTSFQLLHNPQADVSFIEMLNGAPSIAEHNAEVRRLALRYGINVSTVTAGNSVAVSPKMVDVFADFMTTPIFPVSDSAPVDLASAGPGDGLNLESGSSPVANYYFPGSGKTVNIPDETTLRKYVYMNYMVGDLSKVIGSPIDNGQSDNSVFAAVARHYPLGSGHSTTPVLNDGLHMVAFCSKNRTDCSPGHVYGGMIRLPTVIRPGMTVKVRYKAASGAHAWNPVWLFSGEQRTPGPTGDPYRNWPLLADYPAGGHAFEIDINDNCTRSDDGGAPFGSQLDFGMPDIYGNAWPTGKAPRITYAANNGTDYVHHPNAGPQFLALPNLKWSATFHNLVMSWRGDGSNLIDILVDGKVVEQGYIDYSDLVQNNQAGQPLGLHLIIANQAIPSFSPGASTATDNDGIATPGAEGWTQVIQEISVWRGTVVNPPLAVP